MLEPKGNRVFNNEESMLRPRLMVWCSKAFWPMGAAASCGRFVGALFLQSWFRPILGFFLYVPSIALIPAMVRLLIDYLVEHGDEFGS